VAYTAQATLAKDQAFRDRVQIALAKATADVMGEAKGSMSDAVFGKRQALAEEVMGAAFDGPVLSRYVLMVVQNEVITSESLDSDIQFQVNAVWDDIARVRDTD
jgi:hypothetical protein